jgi:hypothetical protein
MTTLLPGRAFPTRNCIVATPCWPARLVTVASGLTAVTRARAAVRIRTPAVLPSRGRLVSVRARQLSGAGTAAVAAGAAAAGELAT